MKNIMTKQHVTLAVTILFLLVVSSISIKAEEGGSGHYLPGSMASFMDGVPSAPTKLARLNYINYAGSIGGNRALPIAGLSALNADAAFNALGLTLLWAPEATSGDKWTYAMSTTIPWLTMDVSADVNAGNSSVRRQDKESGLGDIVLMPIMFNYNHNKNLNSNYRLGIYAPSGDYEVGRLANPGKNYWTFEPMAAIVYLGQENGIEASLFAGVDFNTENKDTDYKSGIQGHVEGTLAQHFPLFKGVAGGGITGFWYRQFTGDSGDGANLGDFKVEANGIGPVVSFKSSVAEHDLIAELKWLHEFENKKRLEGDTIYFKLIMTF